MASKRDVSWMNSYSNWEIIPTIKDKPGNENEICSVIAWSIRCSRSGLYFVALSALFIAEHGLFGLKMKSSGNANNSIGLVKRINGKIQMTTHNVFIVNMMQNDTIAAMYKGHIGMSSLALGGFSLSDTMCPLVAFSLTRSKGQTDPGSVAFDDIIVSSSGVSENKTYFVIITPGVYMITFSAGMTDKKTLIVQICKNNLPIHESADFTGSDRNFRSGAVLVEGESGDNISLVLVKGKLHSSVELKEITLSGFLYSPVSVPLVAWSLFLHINISSPIVHLKSYIVEYDRALVQRGVTVFMNRAVIIRTTGLYYVHMNMACMWKCEVSLYRYAIGLYKNNHTHQIDTKLIHSMRLAISIGHGTMVRLTAGEHIILRITNLNNLLNGRHFQNSFIGFLIGK